MFLDPTFGSYTRPLVSLGNWRVTKTPVIETPNTWGDQFPVFLNSLEWIRFLCQVIPGGVRSKFPRLIRVPIDCHHLWGLSPVVELGPK